MIAPGSPRSQFGRYEPWPLSTLSFAPVRLLLLGYEADVGIKEGRIVAIGGSLTDAEEVVDATGILVLPGVKTMLLGGADATGWTNLAAHRCSNLL